MADLTPKKINLSSINGGREFQNGDGIYPNAVNSVIEGTAYFQTVVDHLVDTPDNSDIDGVGTPDVSFVSSTTADGVTIYKFKFSNLSGATFTPSLDEAGNLSWSNNRNLPNPPTINISGRDYLFSSEVLSGTYIPQVNSEVTDMPLTSFNRAPVDDIDHCYLFYYYTPENIYYWLATQVVDIQETTATLKILSVVRLTGYTPTIGENGNWFIGGEDTGKPSYGASGVTDVVAGASYNQDDFTITPLTFNFEVGNSKTVNVKAAVGNVEDGSYAKLAQVVRTDTAQSLTDEQKTQAQNNMGLDDKYAQLSQVVRTDSAQSLSEAQKQQGQANLGLDEKYAKQDGTYPNLSAGKATADADGNVIDTTYSKLSQVVRTDVVSSNSDEQKRIASENILRYITGSPTIEGWYRVAKLSDAGIYEINVSSSYSINAPVAIKFIVAVSTTSGYNTSITQIGGAPNLTIISQARLNQESGSLYFEIYVTNPNNPIGVSYKAVTSLGNGLSVSNITPVAFTNITSPSNVIAAIKVVCGIATTGGVYQNGSPVLVGSAPTWVTGTSGSITLPSSGWYYIQYNFTSILSADYTTAVFYWTSGRQLLSPISYYNELKLQRCLSISSDGVITAYDPTTGDVVSGGNVAYYKLA